MACSFLFSRRRLRLFYLLPKFPAPTSLVIMRHISTATPPSAQPDPKVSLSARLSFVFDQIDALERQRDTSAKDEALQRIRAWRQSKHPSPLSSSSSSATADTVAHGVNNQGDFLLTDVNRADGGIREFFRREVELVHPWPEWIELMERLVSQNYFDYRRAEEERVAAFAGIDISRVKEEVGLDLTRDWAAMRTACSNFGRDRFDILKSLSRKDIQVLVGHGCPNMDSKVVFSAKILRKYVHIDEGDVCSSCSLRNSCSRGYILVPKEDEARTLDVMRILLTYGFDYIKESVENEPLKKMKSVKTVVRKLLHEVAKLSAIPRDPNLLPPVIKKPPPKVKQPPTQPKRRVGRDDVEMKKGDWLCPKCDFMNFAKNTVCLQCDAKRPKRQLLPGEWECPNLFVGKGCIYNNGSWLNKTQIEVWSTSKLPIKLVIILCQIELFTHVPVLRNFTEHLKRKNFNICVVFLLDSQFITDVTKYISGCMSSLSAMVQLELPHVNILSKMDLVKNKKDLDYYLEPEARVLLSELNQNMAPQYAKLNKFLAELVDEFSMVNFVPLDLRKESSIQYVLSLIDNCIQYGEDADVKIRDFDPDADDD